MSDLVARTDRMNRPGASVTHLVDNMGISFAESQSRDGLIVFVRGEVVPDGMQKLVALLVLPFSGGPSISRV